MSEKWKWRWKGTFVWWKLLDWISKSESVHACNLCDDGFDDKDSVKKQLKYLQKKSVEEKWTPRNSMLNCI